MSKREDYKRLIVFCLASLVVLHRWQSLPMYGIQSTEVRLMNHSGGKVTGC